MRFSVREVTPYASGELTAMLYFQLVIMAGTVLLAYYFEYTDTFPVHVQGFFCYDRSLSKPYPGPEHASRVPPMLLYALVTALPTCTMYGDPGLRTKGTRPEQAHIELTLLVRPLGTCCDQKSQQVNTPSQPVAFPQRP
ncbi:unnamed protein product [Lota lota]